MPETLYHRYNVDVPALHWQSVTREWAQTIVARLMEIQVHEFHFYRKDDPPPSPPPEPVRETVYCCAAKNCAYSADTRGKVAIHAARMHRPKKFKIEVPR